MKGWEMSSKNRSDGLEIRSSKHDSIEALVKKFTRKVRNSGLMQELYDRRFYLKPSQKRRRKSLRSKSIED